MTVIACDGRTIAVDRLALCGDVCSVTRKWRALKGGGLAFLTGALTTGLAIVDWLGRRRKPFPRSDGPVATVIVLRDRLLYEYESDSEGHPIEHDLHEGPFAWGSGGSAAWGAMRHGASARDAVLIASELHASCGMGVEVFDIGGNPL